MACNDGIVRGDSYLHGLINCISGTRPPDVELGKARPDIRSFGLDAIEDVTILEAAAHEVDTIELRRVTQGSYGIFAGQATAWAVLRFTKHRAQWVEDELWHPQQMATQEPDGSYLLKVPYSDDRELLGDILRFGADVQVLEPKELRAKVQKTMLEAVGKYI